jgi:hypothetical protein
MFEPHRGGISRLSILLCNAAPTGLPFGSGVNPGLRPGLFQVAPSVRTYPRQTARDGQGQALSLQSFSTTQHLAMTL